MARRGVLNGAECMRMQQEMSKITEVANEKKPRARPGAFHTQFTRAGRSALAEAGQHPGLILEPMVRWDREDERHRDDLLRFQHAIRAHVDLEVRAAEW